MSEVEKVGLDARFDVGGVPMKLHLTNVDANRVIIKIHDDQGHLVIIAGKTTNEIKDFFRRAAAMMDMAEV